MKLRSIILALFFLCAPQRADAEGKSNYFKTPPCSGVPAIALAEPDILVIPVAMNIFKARAEIKPSQAKVLEHILKGKPCQTPGLIRWRGECYSEKNLKLVKK